MPIACVSRWHRDRCWWCGTGGLASRRSGGRSPATRLSDSNPDIGRPHNYSGALATGTLAAGGTLGILIPPSVMLIVYAIIVEANIAVLFQAAFIPGILATIGYIIAIAIVVRINPKAGPAGERAARRTGARIDLHQAR